TRRRTAAVGFTDPLWPSEWWRAAVGADAAPPLPAGVPLTIVDSGVDITHPDFQGAHITLLNQQFLGDASDDDHGTAVTSVAAAPATDSAWSPSIPTRTSGSGTAAPTGIRS